jgi:hypothetical protein
MEGSKLPKCMRVAAAGFVLAASVNAPAVAHSPNGVVAVADPTNWGFGPNNTRYYQGNVRALNKTSRRVRLRCQVVVRGSDSGELLGSDTLPIFSVPSKERRKAAFEVLYDPFRHTSEGEGGDVELLHCHRA